MPTIWRTSFIRR